MSGYRGIRLKMWSFAAIIALVACFSRNEGPALPERWSRLLPPAPRGWEETAGVSVFSGVALSDYINGGAEVYLAYGFQELAVREFRNKDGARLTVEIYEMDKPENAYGVFSTDSAGERWEIAADASYGSGLLRFWKGPFFVRILCFPADPAIEEVIRETGTRIANVITDPDNRPALLSLLPEENILPDSVCYFHRQTSLNNIRFLGDENLLHLGDEVEALTWKQKLSDPQEGESNLRQMVLLYPSADRAETAIGDFLAKYMQGKGTVWPGTNTLAAQISEKESVAALQTGPWLLITLDAVSPGAAAEAVNSTRAKLEGFATQQQGGTP